MKTRVIVTNVQMILSPRLRTSAIEQRRINAFYQVAGVMSL